MGRGLDHFRQRRREADPAADRADPYEDEAYRLWALKQQRAEFGLGRVTQHLASFARRRYAKPAVSAASVPSPFFPHSRLGFGWSMLARRFDVDQEDKRLRPMLGPVPPRSSMCSCPRGVFSRTMEHAMIVESHGFAAAFLLPHAF